MVPVSIVGTYEALAQRSGQDASASCHRALWRASGASPSSQETYDSLTEQLFQAVHQLISQEKKH